MKAKSPRRLPPPPRPAPRTNPELLTSPPPARDARLRVLMLCAPGREAQSFAALTALERQNPGWPIWVYRSPLRRPITEFWRMLAPHRGSDVLALEDDITSVRGFFDYVADLWRSPHVTSFFHVNRPILGVPVSARIFSYCQAVKLPAAILGRLLDTSPPPHGGGQDDDLGMRLEILREPVVYHRSLVQHLGAVSLAWHGMPLDGREARDFPGEDFDLAQLFPITEKGSP